MNDVDVLRQRLDDAYAVLRAIDDSQLRSAFTWGHHVARGVLVPVSWWERFFLLAPSQKHFLAAVPAALANLDEQLRRCRQEESCEEAPWYCEPTPADPCLLSDQCERCGSGHGLVAVVEDCTLGPSMGLRMACATLCEKCENVPFREIFGPAEIAVRIGRHSAH